MKKMPYRHTIHTLLASILIIAVSSCSLLPSAYRIDIPQGNLLNEDKVEQLTLGMTPRQVQYLLGTPLIMDTFNQNRWDYFYSIKQGDDTSVKRHLMILFKNNKVNGIEDQRYSE